MTLFATTALTGPNGEQISPEQRIPDSWALDDPFVVECLTLGFIENREQEQPSPLGATAPTAPTLPGARGPEQRGNRPPSVNPYDAPAEVGGVIDVGGTADQTHEGSA